MIEIKPIDTVSVEKRIAEIMEQEPTRINKAFSIDDDNGHSRDDSWVLFVSRLIGYYIH